MIRSLVVNNGRLAWLERSHIVSYFVSSQWSRASQNVVGSVAYRSQSLAHPFGDMFDVFRSYFTWQSMIKTKYVSDLKIYGITVGDLIVDSYLRFRPSARFQVTDLYVWKVTWQVYRDIRRANLF